MSVNPMNDNDANQQPGPEYGGSEGPAGCGGNPEREAQGAKLRKREAYVEILQSSDERAIFDRNHLLRQLDGASDIVDKVIALFLTSVSSHLIALSEALGEGNAKQARFHTHTIVGVAANIGAEKVRSVAAEMESLAKAGSLAELPGLVGELRKNFAEFIALVEAEKDEV